MIESLISLDPGKHSIAGAFFRHNELRWVKMFSVAECIRTGWDRNLLPGHASVALWEKPQHDGRDVPLGDIIPLAAFGGVLAGRLGETVVTVEPRDWKGSVPKPQNHRRAWAALSARERLIFANPQAIERAIDNACERGARARWKKSSTYHYRAADWNEVGPGLCHNRLDAIAQGLWYLKRVAR